MSSIFEELETTLHDKSAGAVTERLCQVLREQKDYHGLFYALILGKRLELGLPAVQVGKSDDLPRHVVQPYEDAIREAARTVGQLYLAEGNIGNAWPYFRMIGEPGPVVAAIETVDADDSEKTQQVIEIAFHEGASPRKGFDLLLKRYGICSAITTVGQAMQMPPDVREHCVKRLVQALYAELRERLAADLESRGVNAPAETSVRDLVAKLDWSPDDEFYHVDVSHLGAVTQYAMQLPRCEELQLAIELCEYGQRLSPRFRYHTDPPFEDQYRDYGIYLKVIAGRDVDAGIEHFHAKAEAADPETIGTYPGQVLVTLLDRADRHQEAVAAFSRYLAQTDQRELSCPSLQELCHKAGDFRPLVEVSLRRGDLVNYAAGLLQAKASGAA
jgi:hypothetical protein